MDNGIMGCRAFDGVVDVLPWCFRSWDACSKFAKTGSPVRKRLIRRPNELSAPRSTIRDTSVFPTAPCCPLECGAIDVRTPVASLPRAGFLNEGATRSELELRKMEALRSVVPEGKREVLERDILLA